MLRELGPMPTGSLHGMGYKMIKNVVRQVAPNMFEYLILFGFSHIMEKTYFTVV